MSNLPTMTSDDLVAAVTTLSTLPPRLPIVDGETVRQHINGRIDHGGGEDRWGRFFELADHGEAANRGRLAKFKRGMHQRAPVGWCLIEHAVAAEAWGSQRGWRRLRFDSNRRRWIWR